MSGLGARLRRDAFLCLKGRWGKALAGTFFLFGVGTVLLLAEQFALTVLGFFGNEALQVPFFGTMITPAQAFCSLGAMAAGLMIMAPLTVGIRKWYYRLAEGPTPDLRMIFDYYCSMRLWCGAVSLQFIVRLRTVLFGAVLALPVLALDTGRRMLGGLNTPAAAASEALLFLLTAVTGLTAAVLTFGWSLRYFLAPYYLAEDEDMTVRQALRSSVRAMKGMQGQVLTLLLGWLPLFVSCIFLVPLVFVLPCCQTALAINARYLMGCMVRKEEMIRPHVEADTMVF